LLRNTYLNSKNGPIAEFYINNTGPFFPKKSSKVSWLDEVMVNNNKKIENTNNNK
jgi:hypothetical protein